MMEVKLAEPNNWSTTIKGSGVGASAGIGLRGHIETADVKERVESNHVKGHGVSPFENLRADVDKESIRRPTA